MSGNLFMLFLESEENSKGELVVKDLKVELLGLSKIHSILNDYKTELNKDLQ